MTRKKEAVICDIDGTAACDMPRWSAATNNTNKLKNVNWDIYFDENLLLNDKPIKEIKKIVLKYFSEGKQIIYLTGRHGKLLGITKKWLKNNNFPIGIVLMRENDDYENIFNFKTSKIKEVLKKYNVVFALGDLKEDKAAYDSFGIPNFIVKGG